MWTHQGFTQTKLYVTLTKTNKTRQLRTAISLLWIEPDVFLLSVKYFRSVFRDCEPLRQICKRSLTLPPCIGHSACLTARTDPTGTDRRVMNMSRVREVAFDDTLLLESHLSVSLAHISWLLGHAPAFHSLENT